MMLTVPVLKKIASNTPPSAPKRARTANKKRSQASAVVEAADAPECGDVPVTPFAAPAAPTDDPIQEPQEPAEEHKEESAHRTEPTSTPSDSTASPSPPTIISTSRLMMLRNKIEAMSVSNQVQFLELLYRHHASVSEHARGSSVNLSTVAPEIIMHMEQYVEDMQSTVSAGMNAE